MQQLLKMLQRYRETELLPSLMDQAVSSQPNEWQL